METETAASFANGYDRAEAEPAAGAESMAAERVAEATRMAGTDDAAGRTETTLRQPRASEGPETETVATPPLDEIASLHMNGGGMPVPLRGSLAVLERQNERLDAEGLERILDEADLASRIEHKLLVPVPASAALMVNPNLTENHRYCRPWTAQFLADLARAHAAAFHKPIEVNSAVRTVEYQKRLMRTNGNAADAEGDIVSPHLTGATVDIAKQGLSGKEVAWMRRLLAGLEKAGKIDVEEEFEQACFHITVYKSYAGSMPLPESAQPGTNQGAGGRQPAGIAVGAFAAQGH